MATRYFKIGFDSKMTKHPKGKLTEVIFSEGEHKKMAFELAAELLIEKDAANEGLFKLPYVIDEYGTVEDYIIAQPKPEAAEPPANKHASFNDDESKGITDNDLRVAVALIVLYGFTDEYTDEIIKDSTAFADAPFNGSDDEQKAFGSVYEAVTEFMPAIYKSIDDKQLLKLVNHIEHHLKSNSANVGDIKSVGIDFITSSLGLEYQQQLTDVTAEQNTPEPKKEPLIIELEQLTDTEDEKKEAERVAIAEEKALNEQFFQRDLSALNSRIGLLQVGESLTLDNISNRLYHSCNCYSKSSLDIINKDPSLIEWSKNAPRNPEKEEALIFGTAFHTMVLEPENFDDEFIVLPKLNMRTNAGKAELAELKELAERNRKIVLTIEQHEHLKLMHGSVFAHPTAKKLLSDGIAERSIFYRMSENVVIRIRPDWIVNFAGRDFIVDLKSCPDVKKFDRSIDDYRYHVQDALYSYIYEMATGKKPVFAFIATGKAVELGKYPTRVVMLDEHDKEVGKQAFEENIATLEECLTSGIWGGFETITRPAYARRNDLI